MELGAIGPVTHAMMIMADLGADVVRVGRPAGDAPFADIEDMTMRGRRQFEADLKSAEGRRSVLELVSHADVLVEGNRPGICEKLGVGPEDCARVNPSLIYARMTGWGQTGPLAERAGHDINYLSVTGALDAIGHPGGPPVVPLNLVGDFGGGSMFLVTGILSALLERYRTGQGTVLDVAMVDGITALEQPVLSMLETGGWREARGSNLIDGGAPFYGVYECADGRYVAVGALEPQFFAELIRGLGLDDGWLPVQADRTRWPVLRELLADVFKSRSRDEWARLFQGTDACVTPVLSFSEARSHPHLASRGTVRTGDSGMPVAAPAPRRSGEQPDPLPSALQRVEYGAILAEWREKES